MESLPSHLEQRLERALAKLRDEYGQYPGLVLLSGWDSTQGPGGGRDTFREECDAWREAGFEWRMPGSVLAKEWPAELPPLPLTVGAALGMVEERVEAMAAQIARDIEESAKAIVKPEYLEAVLGRIELLADGWPWRAHGKRDGWTALDALFHEPSEGRAVAALSSSPMETTRWRRWPSEAAPAKVVRWSRDALDKLSDGQWSKEDEWSLAEQGYPLGFGWSDDAGESIYLPAEGRALLYLAEQDVRAGQHRTGMAIDASRAHHALLSGWRDLPKTGGIPVTTEPGHQVTLKMPGNAVQLSLNLAGEEALHEQVIHALRQWRGVEGLRNWAVLQRLLSVEGGRRGWFRWTLDSHMAGLGYSDRQRRDPAVCAAVALEVELLTKLEISETDSAGKERLRRPVLLVGGRFEKLRKSAWRLDGLELQINPMLYSGVRNMETGKLGSNYLWAPLEVGQLNARRWAPALVLGLLLPIRFRWAMGEGRDELVLTGKSLLRAAAITLDSRKAHRAWSRLESNLDKLVEIGSLGGWEWYSGEERTLAGRCRMRPAAWAIDRYQRGILPLETPPADMPETGAELREWRRRHGLGQSETATMLHLSQSTISKAESQPAKRLGTKMRAGLAELQRFGDMKKAAVGGAELVKKRQ